MVPPWRSSQSHTETRLMKQRCGLTRSETSAERRQGDSVLLESQRCFREEGHLGWDLKERGDVTWWRSGEKGILARRNRQVAEW